MATVTSKTNSEFDWNNAPTPKEVKRGKIVSYNKFFTEIKSGEYGRTSTEIKAIEVLPDIFKGWKIDCDLDYMSIYIDDRNSDLSLELSLASNTPCTYVKIPGLSQKKINTSILAYVYIADMLKKLKESYDHLSSWYGY